MPNTPAPSSAISEDEYNFHRDGRVVVVTTTLTTTFPVTTEEYSGMTDAEIAEQEHRRVEHGVLDYYDGSGWQSLTQVVVVAPEAPDSKETTNG